MENKLDGIVGVGIGPRQKQVVIKEVENGWTIHLDKNGYAYDEKTFIAKDVSEVVKIIQDNLK